MNAIEIKRSAEKLREKNAPDSGLKSSPGSSWLSRAWSKLDRKNFWALWDQAIVSGMSLIAVVIIGRECGADGLGTYSLGITIVVFVLSMHNALVSTPYTVFRIRFHGNEGRRFAGSSLVSSCMVTTIAWPILVISAIAFYQFQYIPGFEEVILAITLLLPFLVLREFARRYYFAHLRMDAAAGIDFVVAVLQLVVLVGLAQSDRLTPINAIVAMGFACAVVCIVWLHKNAIQFSIDKDFVKENLWIKWTLGRWVLVDNLFTMATLYVVPWLLVFLIDTAATGILAACVMIVNLSSPFLQGMGNSLSPQFAAAAAKRSTDLIHRKFWKSTVFMTSVMAAFGLFCMLAGEPLLEKLFKGDQYSGHGMIITILALRALIGSAYIAANHALLAVERPLPSLLCSMLGIFVTATAGLWLIPVLGILGGAVAMLLGSVVEVSTIMIGYTMVLRKVKLEWGKQGI